MTTVRNASESRRRWDTLVDTEKRTTLELDPGEEADTVLPDGFEGDPHLEVLDAVDESPPPPPPFVPPVLTDPPESADSNG